MFSVIESLATRLGSLARDMRGTVATTFGVTSTVLVGSMGMMIDYGIVQSQRTQIYNAADVAAVAGAKATTDYLRKYGINRTSEAVAEGRKVANAFFAADTAKLAFATPPQLKVGITVDGNTARVALRADTTMNTVLLPVLGIKTVDIGAEASAVSELPLYYQIIFAVDVSGSMAIGGSPEDIAALNAHPRIGCAFACHMKVPNNEGRADTRSIAKSAGITLKIDYVNRALSKFTSRVKELDKQSPGHFSLGVMTIGTTYKMVQAPTANLTLAQAAVDGIDVEYATPESQNHGFTYVSDGLTKVARDMTPPGDGLTPLRPKTYVIFFSDGIQDVPPPGNIMDRRINLDYVDACKTIKSKGTGATLAAIHTPYDIKHDLVNSYLPYAPLTMAACATDKTWSFRAENGSDIQKAVDQVLKNISSGLRLSS